MLVCTRPSYKHVQRTQFDQGSLDKHGSFVCARVCEIVKIYGQEKCNLFRMRRRFLHSTMSSGLLRVCVCAPGPVCVCVCVRCDHKRCVHAEGGLNGFEAAMRVRTFSKCGLGRSHLQTKMSEVNRASIPCARQLWVP